MEQCRLTTLRYPWVRTWNGRSGLIRPCFMYWCCIEACLRLSNAQVDGFISQLCVTDDPLLARVVMFAAKRTAVAVCLFRAPLTVVFVMSCVFLYTVGRFQHPSALITVKAIVLYTVEEAAAVVVIQVSPPFGIVVVRMALTPSISRRFPALAPP